MYVQPPMCATAWSTGRNAIIRAASLLEHRATALGDMMFRPGPRNLITDVNGLLVGNATDHDAGTGVTTILFDHPWTTAVDIGGGGPGLEAHPPAIRVYWGLLPRLRAAGPGPLCPRPTPTLPCP